jgi:DNA invertase Pin-like site-specific DNA recombinase
MEDLNRRGVHFRSLTEDINTATPGGKLVFHIFAAIAEFERSIILERTRAGIHAAQQRGVKFGRKPKLTAHQIRHARTLIKQGEAPQSVASLLGVSRATVYRALAG